MKKALFISLLFLLSCNNKKDMDSLEVLNYSFDGVDSILKESKKINDSASKTLITADDVTEKKVIEVVNRVNRINAELNSLKSTMRIVSKEIVHDTIYITEKKNFWGKTKITIDSSKSTTENVDTLLNENKN